ncbi:MAG TPA: hypothetical protein VK356_13870 [Thermomicrobiales bacterium]|nr:hypothetical protein [Thermomicrobiales bacterium]
MGGRFRSERNQVRGGYEDTSLADIALSWMVEKALSAQEPLRLDQDPRQQLRPNPTGKLHDSREGFWLRLLYREVWRSVCKGHQEPLSKVTEKTGDAFLHTSWLARLGTLYSDYNSPHLGSHPDYRRAVDQLERGLRPPQGPWVLIR